MPLETSFLFLTPQLTTSVADSEETVEVEIQAKASKGGWLNLEPETLGFTGGSPFLEVIRIGRSGCSAGTRCGRQIVKHLPLCSSSPRASDLRWSAG